MIAAFLTFLSINLLNFFKVTFFGKENFDSCLLAYKIDNRLQINQRYKYAPFLELYAFVSSIISRFLSFTFLFCFVRYHMLYFLKRSYCNFLR